MDETASFLNALAVVVSAVLQPLALVVCCAFAYHLARHLSDNHLRLTSIRMGYSHSRATSGDTPANTFAMPLTAECTESREEFNQTHVSAQDNVAVTRTFKPSTSSSSSPTSRRNKPWSRKKLSMSDEVMSQAQPIAVAPSSNSVVQEEDFVMSAPKALTVDNDSGTAKPYGLGKLALVSLDKPLGSSLSNDLVVQANTVPLVADMSNETTDTMKEHTLIASASCELVLEKVITPSVPSGRASEDERAVPVVAVLASDAPGSITTESCSRYLSTADTEGNECSRADLDETTGSSVDERMPCIFSETPKPLAPKTHSLIAARAAICMYPYYHLVPPKPWY